MSELYGLPEGWEWKRLEDCTYLITKGTTPTTYGYAFLDKGINFLKIENIIKGKIDLNSINKFISEEANQSQKRSILKHNDVLFSIAGTIGDTAIVKEEHLPMNTNQAIAIIRPTELLNPVFLQHSLLSIVSERTKKKQRGGAIKNISLTDIKNIEIPLPPLQEQKRIVAKLDSLFAKIDQAIALHQQNIDEAEALMGSVLNEVFGELEEKGIISRKRMNECFIVKDGTHDSPKYIKENGYPLFTSKNLKEYGIDRSNFKLIKEEDYYKINQRSKVDKGDLLFAMIGTIGNPTLVDFEPDFAIKNVALFKSLDNEASMEYLRYYLMSNFVINKMRDEANGATQRFVGLTYLRNFPFPYTSLKTQQKTVQYLDQLSQKTQALKKAQQEKMQGLKDLKASLLDRAFRGEI